MVFDMNPKLIKHDLDGDEYANACPTIGALLVAHYSTPQHHRADLYAADADFFSWYPAQRIYLRPAFPMEFDIEENSSRPTLWVQVIQLSPGFHQILPVWRGKAFWNGPESDSDEGVAHILLQMALRNGMNLSDWMGYIYDQRILKLNRTARKAKKALVH